MNDDLLARLTDLVQNRYFGKYRGTVTGHDRLSTRGRVEVKVPAVLGDLAVIAEICVPYAGNGVGLMLLPEVNSGCWVEFEGGDPSYPIWVGAYWGDGQMPAATSPVDATGPRLLRSGSAEVRLDDASRTLTAQSDSGGTLKLNGAASMNAGQLAGDVTASSSSVKLTKGTKTVEVNDMMVSVNGGNLDVN